MSADDVLQSSAFEAAIRNPADRNHLMVIKPAGRRIRIYSQDVLLADSTSALRVMEIGRGVYDPVLYIPEDDLKVAFAPLDKSTHCPIKGDASYVSLNGTELGWAYQTPLAMSDQLANHYAFWPDKVRLVEGE
jgi:uncharacterized protein (DUF427 family)